MYVSVYFSKKAVDTECEWNFHFSFFVVRTTHTIVFP